MATVTEPPPSAAEPPAADPPPADGLADLRREGFRLRRRRTPTVIQMEAVECGAAALAIVLGFFGRFVPLEELRVACGVTRDGSRAGNIVAAARSYGLIAKGFQMEAEELRSVRKPVIIYWAFQHFMVVESIQRRFGRTVVHVNDPATGPRTIDWEIFDSGFTGVVLSFEPGPEFTPGGRPTKVVEALLNRRQPTGGALLLVLLASLLLVVPGLIAPAFSRVFIDNILVGGEQTYLCPLLGVMVAAMAATMLLTWIQQRHLLRIEMKLAVTSTARFFRHLLRLPLSFFVQRQPAEVAARVSANDMVAEILSRDVATTLVSLVLVVFYAVLLIHYDVLLAAIGIVMALLNILVLRWVARARTDAVERLRADRGKLAAASFNTLKLIETIKASGAEPDAFARWSGFLAKMVTVKQRLGVSTAVITTVPPMLATANVGLILFIGGLRAIDGAISIGLLVAFQTLLSGLSLPVAQLTNLGERLQDVTADVNRLYDVERYPVAPCFVDPPELGSSRLDGRLDFEGVGFSYGPLDEPAIRNLSFSLAPGRRTAVVGGSGSGKSTVGRLAAGLHEPTTGAVLLDGNPRQSVSRAVLATSVSFVDQDAFLFEGTVRENVTLWDDTVPEEDVIAALRDALIYDVVAARPGGVNSRIDEGGRNLSGGQRQRLELARALVTKPTLLILDEATSALDPETERLIADNLRRRGCACLIIAHRLSTVRDADEIIVMRAGEVVERGRHHTLIAGNGPYAALIAAADDAPPAETPSADDVPADGGGA
ncbi:NHLP family bacteriocin export ABC transporter peptidase/permease/ATPase subunit [Streptacidiphilus sp. EB129]|uniref:NHLP family bacteriocin export ABC transporter peptidase/permease/ATPase subunit n=1 Tax=Streptacidiphilus sp. EB129 TaxID=3156262 RepID=UPI003518397E